MLGLTNVYDKIAKKNNKIQKKTEPKIQKEKEKKIPF